MNSKSLLISVLAAGLTASLLGCSNPAPDSVAETSTQTSAGLSPAAPDSALGIEFEDGVTEITWEDLLPAGEEEILETLYVEFYEDFEKRLLGDSGSLMDAASEDADLSALIAEGSDDDTMEQIGTFNVVPQLNGKHIRIPGYVVPFDFSAEAKHKEFLLVPYFGACLHTPPPPPNQIIFVTADPAATLEDVYGPVWLEGVMETGEYLNDLGNSAYELKLSKIEPYEY